MKRSVFPIVGLFSSVLSSSIATNAAEFEYSLKPSAILGELELSYETRPGFYYVLATLEGASFEPIETLDLYFDGETTNRDLTIDLGNSNAAFIKLAEAPFASPGDFDRDGIDDLYERERSGFLDLADASDSFGDEDSDGLSNFEEYLRGTDPEVSGNFQPRARIVTPEAEIAAVLGAPLAWEASAYDRDGEIVQVDFLVDGELLQAFDTEPYSLSWTPDTPGSYVLTTIAYDDLGAASNPETIKASVQVPFLGLVASETNTRSNSVKLSGDALPGALVRVVGGAEVVVAEVPESGLVELVVPLKRDRMNRLFACQETAGGVTSPQQSFEIIQDSAKPTLHIDFPDNDAVTTSDSAVIAGRVGDMLSGYEGLDVSVNGLPANVIVGIGPNGTFERSGVPLELGENLISVVASDIHGNRISREITINRVDVEGPRITVLSGDLQQARINQLLPEPVEIQLTRADGTPIENKLVSFKVTRSNGRLFASQTEEGDGELARQLFTDAEGRAKLWWRLGTDAGCGNNRLLVSSVGVSVPATLCASADPGIAKQINVGMGHNQRGETGGPAFEPLRAWVSDSCNGVEGIPVTFRVVRGGGLVEGLSEVTVPSTLTGHAQVRFTLGAEPGIHIVEANFQGNESGPAVFTVYGAAREEGQATQYTGVVLDNASQPMGNVECSIDMGGVTVATVVTGDDGRFAFEGIPEGPGILHVAAVNREVTVDGVLNPVGSYPDLAYEIIVVPSALNEHPSPVLLPRLDPENAVPYDGAQDVELTVKGMEGLKMIVKAGSMRLRDGSLPTVDSPVTLALNQVHHDDIPMPMPDGAAPPFAWTLQPAGATFDPPIKIEYPNMSGLPAGGIAYFLSFDHDTERFEIVASGQVSDDGSIITTDPGVGLSVAGWGCNCPPYSITADCGDCGGDFKSAAESWLKLGLEFRKAAKAMIDGVDCARSLRKAFDSGRQALSSGSASDGLSFANSAKSTAIKCGEFLAFKKVKAAGATASSAIDALADTAKAASCLAEGSEGPTGQAIERAQHVKSVLESLNKLNRDRGSTKARVEAVCSAIGLLGDLASDAQGGGGPWPPTDIAGETPEEFFIRLDSETARIERMEGDVVEGRDQDYIAQLEQAIMAYDLLEADLNEVVALNGNDSIRDFEIRVGAQSSRVDFDGSFLVSNIQAADQFGANGPGSRPDFQSDDCVRLTGVSTKGNQIQYLYSEPFRLSSGVTKIIDSITISDTPPPIPESISAAINTPTLTEIGQQAQITVTAMLGDGTEVDVTSDVCTAYRNSNNAIVSVDSSGVVTALSRGKAYITLVNEGATAVLQVDVSPGDPLTDVYGFVVDSTGDPVEGATVRVPGLAGSTTTLADGSFVLNGVATQLGISSVLAEISGPQRLTGTSVGIQAIPGGSTDGGIITLLSLCDAVEPCLDTDGDSIPDHLEIPLLLNENLLDSDSNNVPDGEEDFDGDGVLNFQEVLNGTPIAKELSGGTVFEGSLQIAAIDRFQFDAVAGERYFLGLGRTAGGGNPSVSVYGSDGSLIINDDFGATAFFELSPVSDDTYYVIVRELGDNNPYDYRLEMQRLPGPTARIDEGGVLASGLSRAGTINPGDVDLFTFEADAGDKLIFSLAATSGNGRTRLQVFDSQGSELGDVSDNSFSSIFEIDAVEAEEYTLVVRENGDDSFFSYEVAAHRILGEQFGLDEGGVLLSGRRTLGSIGLGDIDLYNFEAEIGERLILNLALESGLTGRTRLQLYDPTGAELIADDSTNGLSSVIDLEVVEAGAYTLVVRENGDDSAYEYAVTATRLSPEQFSSDEGGRLSSGLEQSGVLELGDVDIFTIEADAGDFLIFNLAVADGNGRARLQVVGPGSEIVGDNTNNGLTAAIEAEASVDGEYTIVVRENGDDNAFDYRLLATRLVGEQFALDEGGLLQNGLAATGSLILGDVDVFAFEADVGAPMIFNLASTSAPGDNGRTRLQVFGPDGALLGDNTNNGFSSVVDAVAALSGEHTIVVRENLDNDVFSYRLQATSIIEEQFADDEGGPIGAGQVSSGIIATGDVDVYAYAINNGQQVTINLTATAENGRTRLQAYSSAGQLLGDDSNNGATSQIILTGTADETLFLVVRENGDNDTFFYDLLITEN